jgi:hypothetical protein
MLEGLQVLAVTADTYDFSANKSICNSSAGHQVLELANIQCKESSSTAVGRKRTWPILALPRGFCSNSEKTSDSAAMPIDAHTIDSTWQQQQQQQQQQQ